MTAHPLPQGTQVRLSRDLTDDEKGWAKPPRYAKEFTLDEFLEGGDAAKDEIFVPFYYGSDEHGSYDVVVPADAVEVVRTAAQMAARRPPTAAAIRSAISTNLLDDYDDFALDESDRDGEHSLELYGRTTDGLPFSCRITVASVWETDL